MIRRIKKIDKLTTRPCDFLGFMVKSNYSMNFIFARDHYGNMEIDVLQKKKKENCENCFILFMLISGKDENRYNQQ